MYQQYQQNKSAVTKANYGQARNCCKRVCEAARLPRNFAFVTLRKLPIPALFNGSGILSSAADKARFCAISFSRDSNFDDAGIFLPTFPSTYLNLSELHNLPVTPKMVKNVITDLSHFNVTCPDCIPVTVLKNWEPDFSYILVVLFNMFMKESCFFGQFESLI